MKHQQKLDWRIIPSLIYLKLLEVYVCLFFKWIPRSSNLCWLLSLEWLVNLELIVQSLLNICFIEGQFTPWTMKLDHGRWPFPMVWLKTNSIYKAFGPSLGVNWMWTKRNDHPQKLNVVIFFIYAQKGQFWVSFKFDSLFFLVFSSLHLLLFPKVISLKKYITSFLCHVPLPFLLEHFFGLSHRKTYWIMSVDYVGLKKCLLGTSNSMVILSFCPCWKLK